MDDAGATMVEYCLMASLIAIVCIAAVSIIGHNTNAFYVNAANKM
ncbi:MAG: Flp family type IVb pilin [Vulcanimicrobiaceae bacterium]